MTCMDRLMLLTHIAGWKTSRARRRARGLMHRVNAQNQRSDNLSFLNWQLKIPQSGN